MRITIENAENAEPEALQAGIKAALRWSTTDPHTGPYQDVNDAVIWVIKRKPSGWLEYTVVIWESADRPVGSRNPRVVITTSVIQRQPGAEFESHSHGSVPSPTSALA